jgi:hypothetical protein
LTPELRESVSVLDDALAEVLRALGRAPMLGIRDDEHGQAYGPQMGDAE